MSYTYHPQDKQTNKRKKVKCPITIFSKIFKGKSTIKKQGKSTITSRGNDDAEVLSINQNTTLTQPNQA